MRRRTPAPTAPSDPHPPLAADRMWSVQYIDTQPSRLDLRASGQGFLETSVLVVDGIEFANAPARTSWTAERFQPRVCDCCGIENCQPGGWLSLRRVDDQVVFLPAFDSMAMGPWERDEYAPPAFAYRRGLPVFSAEVFGELRRAAPDIPPLRSIRRLTGREAAHWLQWEAPAWVLGRFPDPPRITPQQILAVSDGEVTGGVRRLMDAIFEFQQSEMPAVLQREADRPLVFFLDTDPVEEWIPLGIVEGRDALHFAPDWLLAPG